MRRFHLYAWADHGGPVACALTYLVWLCCVVLWQFRESSSFLCFFFQIQSLTPFSDACDSAGAPPMTSSLRPASVSDSTYPTLNLCYLFVMQSLQTLGQNLSNQAFFLYDDLAKARHSVHGKENCECSPWVPRVNGHGISMMQMSDCSHIVAVFFSYEIHQWAPWFWFASNCLSEGYTSAQPSFVPC